MNPKISLKTERLLLRTLLPSDVCDAYVQGLNDPEVNRFLFDTRFMKQTREAVAQFVKANLKSPTDILFGLFIKEGNELIGTIRISKISKIHFSCSLGICIFGKKYWGSGVGTEAVLGVVDYLFNELGLHYVEAGAYIENKASIAMFQKAGFEMQAEFKNKFRYDKDFMPVVFLGRVNKNFGAGCVREVKRKDSKNIWEIRNHPLNRLQFSHEEEILFHQHDQWFMKNYFEGKKNRCFVLEKGKRGIVGYCRFDFSSASNQYCVSIAVHPDFQGMGLGGKLLRESVNRMKTGKAILAEVKKNNTRSENLFLRSGFKKHNQKNEKYYYKFIRS